VLKLSVKANKLCLRQRQFDEGSVRLFSTEYIVVVAFGEAHA
jgi:hypothetical protein